MNQLRAIQYLKNNKKQAAILVVSFGLYFSLLYGIHFFINPMYYTDEAIIVGQAERMQSVYIADYKILPVDRSLFEKDSGATDEEKITELNRAISEFAKKLEQDERIDRVIPCANCSVQIHSFTGSSQYYVPLASQDDVSLICDYMDVKLLEGSYPVEGGDILMDQKMAKNLKVKVGDTLQNPSYRVCGITANKNYFAVGKAFDEELVKRNLFFLDQGTMKDLSLFFSEMNLKAEVSSNAPLIILSDTVNGRKEVEEFKRSTEDPLSVVSYICTFVMGVVLYFVYQLHIKDRYEEWCLYRSIGFSQRDIFMLAIREYGICMLGSAVFALISTVVFFIVGGKFMDEKGIVFYYWIPKTFKELLLNAIFLSGVLTIPVFQAMRHITTIDAIEDDI